MKIHKFKTELLIRDKRLEWMQNQGVDVAWRTLSDGEFETHLRNKLIEEATEAAQELKTVDLIEELGDVFEVIDCLMDLKGISREAVLEAQAKKAEKLGGFDDRIYTQYVQLKENDPGIEYYFKNADKYPEIKD